MMEQGDSSHAAIAGRRAVLGSTEHPYCAITWKITRRITRGFCCSLRALSLAYKPTSFLLVIKLSHRPGALHHALEPFAQRGIDLLKIESRPVQGTPWQYHFYLDLQASTHDAHAVEALQELRERADEVRVLGCYISAATQSESANTKIK
ncbi:MAG: ACT domain-containing protein [Pyrinomonadaceae bacterium]